MKLLCNVAPGVETMAVSPVNSISVIGLIIDASIPAGAGHSARNTAVVERGKREEFEGGRERERERGKGKVKKEEKNGGMRANKRRYLECCSSSAPPQDDTWSVSCVSTHTH